MKEEHVSSKAERLDNLPQYKKDYLLEVWLNSKRSARSLSKYAKELNVVPLTLVRRVKYWQFLKHNNVENNLPLNK